MSEPALSPCAGLVRKSDPDLFLAAMFAREPLRERLMVLIAFDIELSRATQRRAEPLIAQMRLQWWRDVIAEAAGEAPLRQHEVALPLGELVRASALTPGLLEPMIAAREIELNAPLTPERFADWSDARFGGLLRAAMALAGTTADRAATVMGQAIAVAFALRNARAMAGEGVYLLPLAGLDRGALARGETTEGIRDQVSGLAQEALSGLASLRRADAPRAARPVLRLGWRAAPQLRRAQKPDLDMARDFLTLPGGGSLRLLLLSLTGRY
ncbi:squalene/phytoene synthase family protein [Rhodobacteraceae bacterium NNCM2]|nr:squalene/phytoene synthase family protein [Coraliihabitans acroporae]